MEAYLLFTLKECAYLFLFWVMNSLIMTTFTIIKTRSHYIRIIYVIVDDMNLLIDDYTTLENKIKQLEKENRNIKRLKSNPIPSHIKNAYITSQINLNTECSLCLDNINSINSSHLTNCGHLFHTECFNQIRMVRNERKCPTCRT